VQVAVLLAGNAHALVRRSGQEVVGETTVSLRLILRARGEHVGQTAALRDRSCPSTTRVLPYRSTTISRWAGISRAAHLPRNSGTSAPIRGLA